MGLHVRGPALRRGAFLTLICGVEIAFDDAGRGPPGWRPSRHAMLLDRKLAVEPIRTADGAPDYRVCQWAAANEAPPGGSANARVLLTCSKAGRCEAALYAARDIRDEEIFIEYGDAYAPQRARASYTPGAATALLLTVADVPIAERPRAQLGWCW